MKFIIDSEGYFIGFGGPNTELSVGQQEVPFPPNQDLFVPVWDFETEKYYDAATEEEIQLKIQSEIPETPLWRIRAVLKMMGQEENIANALLSLPEPTRTGAEYVWNYGTVIERNSQTVLFLQSVLQMTDKQVNEIFIQANNISI